MTDRVSRLAVIAISSALAAGCGQSALPGLNDGPSSEPQPQRGLYAGPEPRPGPALLYAPPPRAPQLENVGIWRAPPILISGASAYVAGEFLYQDYLYDDHGAGSPEQLSIRLLEQIRDATLASAIFSRPGGQYRYPDDPLLAGNAADLVEFRVRALADATAFRITLNTLQDPSQVAFTLALGDSPTPKDMPLGANTRVPAAFFVTVADGRAFWHDAEGTLLPGAIPVTVDPERHQIEVRLPHRLWNPGRQRVPMALGVGLWDPQQGAYRRPEGAVGSAPSAFYNVAFRYEELSTELVRSLIVGDVLLTPAWWRNKQQAAALSAGDITPFRAFVDFGRLQDGVTDRLENQPGGTPTVGALNRIFASRFKAGEGVDPTQDCGTTGNARSCVGRYVGTLQPYALYVPDRPPPERGFGLTLLLHSLGGNHNQYDRSNHQRQLGERGRGHLVATPLARGPDGWYVDAAEADVFEVWADVARHYPLDPDYAAITGVSMGGYGSYRLATRYPDLFSALHSIVGPPAIGVYVPPLQPDPGPASNTTLAMESLLHVPVLSWVALADELVPYPGPLLHAERLRELGLRVRFETYSAEHLTFSFNDEYTPGAAFLGDEPVPRNPAQVHFIRNPAMDFPERGLVADRAYWLSGIESADGGLGLLEAHAGSLGVGAPTVEPPRPVAGALVGGVLPALPFTGFEQRWASPAPTPPEDRLVLRTRNLRALTIHAVRVGLSCRARVEADVDIPVDVTWAGCGRVDRLMP